MTAAFQDDSAPNAAAYCAADAAIRRVGLTCRTAIDGRRAARALAEWAGHFSLTEPGLQVLWCLRAVPESGLDQTSIAARLACSAAQISNTIEHLRQRGWVVQQALPGDRRRNVWQLSEAGNELLSQMLKAAGYLQCGDPPARAHERGDDRAQEAAA